MGEALAIGSALVKGGAEVMSGRAQASSARMKAARAQIDAMAADTRAVQLNTAYYEQLRTTFGTIDSLNAARGVAVNGGGTNAALFDEAMERSDRARTFAVANERMQARRLRSDSQILFDGAEGYELAGLLRAAPNFLSAGQSLTKLKFGKAEA